MSDELKPCPFCGSTEVTDMQYDGDFWVQCAGCNCSTQAESHKAWNARAQPSDGALTNEGVEPVGELRELAEHWEGESTIDVEQMQVELNHLKTKLYTAMGLLRDIRQCNANEVWPVCKEVDAFLNNTSTEGKDHE
jgi:hypothetical protein